MIIRPGQDTDGPALIALIWSCWSAYPGIRMDVEREMPELHALASHYHGALWVAENQGAVSGMIAVRPTTTADWEICRLYVHPSQHGTGLGQTLLDHAERHAVAAGAGRLHLFSDTRFERAHRFYEKHSYIRLGPLRVLNDISNSLEFGYAKPVNGIQTLDLAAAASAKTRLAALLVACVADGASVSFRKPLAPEKAQAFWHEAALASGTGKRAIVAAWQDGVLIGTGMLDLATPENQPHRAEVQKILVHPNARRRGVGRRILQALECVAADRGRSLLTLDTLAGEAGEALYRSQGWQEAGRIPGYAQDEHGVPQPTVLFWKQIPTSPRPTHPA